MASVQCPPLWGHGGHPAWHWGWGAAGGAQGRCHAGRGARPGTVGRCPWAQSSPAVLRDPLPARLCPVTPCLGFGPLLWCSLCRSHGQIALFALTRKPVTTSRALAWILSALPACPAPSSAFYSPAELVLLWQPSRTCAGAGAAGGPERGSRWVQGHVHTLQPHSPAQGPCSPPCPALPSPPAQHMARLREPPRL